MIKYSDFISNYFYQQIAFLITSFLVKTKITPNIITLISLFLGIISAILVYLRSPILAIIFLNFSFILDCVDGQLARVKKLESDFGMWLDNVSDRIVENIIILSIGFLYINNTFLIKGVLLLIFLNMLYAYMNDMVIYQGKIYRTLTVKEKIIFSPIYFISRSMIIPLLSLLIIFPSKFVWILNAFYFYGIIFKIYREISGKI
ncbi:CDP-alcohol phosphatidyltransferase family protein [Lebetimonas natsushimae]|uniref:CDP-alcohol phosphatidyltransferase family protein n=1 Tax=Lebetimonas natsushimae TaxID=1936991 RepID=UPI00155348F3|nr:CDP-alcohol phosphatidyltransferase family protein [Lebetimonas natsushimae]